MTTKQRMSILLDRWPKACRAQGWNPQDRALRLQTISQAVGRPITTMNQLDNSADIDAVYAHLGRLADQVKETVETLNPTSSSSSIVGPELGARRRLFHLIHEHAAELGGDLYILHLARDKFHLTQGLNTIDDLTTTQLRQLMFTLNARRRAAERRNANLEVSSSVAITNPF